MTIKVHEKLLLTGAAGGLGKALRKRLKANCSVLRLSDVQPFGAADGGEEIFLADLADYAGMNKVWDAWVPQGNTPPRATVEAKLATTAYRVEIVITAAQ